MGVRFELADAGDCLEVASEGVDESAGGFDFASSDKFPYENVTFRSRCHKIAIVGENNNIQNLVINFSKVLILTDKFLTRLHSIHNLFTETLTRLLIAIVL